MANNYDVIAKKYRSQFLKIKESSKKLAHKTSVSAAAHGQTFLLMIILSSTYLVQEEIEESKIKIEDINEKELAKLIGKVTTKIINSSEIWASLTSSIALVEIAKKGFDVAKHSQIAKSFQKELSHNSKLRRLFSTFLKNTILANIIFVGWDFGGSLYKMARDSLESDSEYEIAATMSSLLKNPEVFKKIFSQIYIILIKNEETRSLLFWNLFRQKILTGEFATLVASMSAAMTAGSILFPGGGTALGFVFGLVGGGIYLMLPQESKDRLTLFFQGLREKFWLSGESGEHWYQYSNALEAVMRITASTINNNEPMPPMLAFPKLEESTNKILSIYFEKAYLFDTQLQLIKDKLNLAYAHENQEYIDLYTNKQNEIETAYLENLESIEYYMAQKLNEIKELIKTYPINFYDQTLVENYPILNQIKKYLNNINAQYYFLKGLTRTIKNEFQYDMMEKSYYTFLFEMYFYGYDQEKNLNAIF